MKAEDLRKGNYVTQNGELIKGITTNSIHKFDLGQIKLDPIPLTESELEKLGIIKKYEENPFEEGRFTFEESKYYTWVKGAFNLEIDKDGKIMFEVYSHYIPVDWVHQFQNLYYLLTNEELTYIK